ncbi:MAG: AsmA family protein [Alphaproteobacteria bacterium]
MKKIIIGFLVVVVVVIAAALIVPAFIPVDVYKRQIIAGIEDATGRRARIDGDFKLSILPRVEFVAGKVALGNAKGGRAETMLSLDRLTVRVGVLPLLSGNLEVDALVAERPVINLEVDKAGRPNWDLGSGGKPESGAGSKAGSSSGGADGGPGLSGLKLGDVRLVDGRVTYSDLATGARHEVDRINLNVALPSLDSPMRAEGSVVWNKEQLELTATLSRPNALMAGQDSDVDIRLKSAPVAFSFKGRAATGKVNTLVGAIDLDVSSVRKLAAWAGSPLNAPGTGLGPLKVTGNLDAKGGLVAFRKAKLSLDSLSGTGDLSVDARGRKPVIVATLKLGQLDLNPYLPPDTAPAKKAAPEPNPAPSAGKGGAGEWSDAPIDLSGLNAADATLDLGVAGITVRKIKVGPSKLKVSLRNGTLVSDLTEMTLYDGTGKAKITTTAEKGGAAVAMTAELAKFKANPFLRDAMDLDRIEGTANATVNVTTRGRSQREMISALNGDGKIAFLNGAIKGVNIAAMVRNIGAAFMDSAAGKAQQTDFSEMGGTFQIRNGILSNNDLALLSPLMRVTGKGTVNLPQRRIDYRLEPKAVASLKGQGGKTDASGVAVPVIVKGPWHDISYTPDLAGALGNIAKDPKSLDALKKLIPGLGGKESGGTDSGQKPAPINPLKELFGR